MLTLSFVGHDPIGDIANSVSSPWRRSTDQVCRHQGELNGTGVRLFAGIDRAKSRRCAMKRSTTGLTVRFLRVNITNGHGRTGSSTANIFTGNWMAMDLGMTAMNWPLPNR